MVDLITHDIGNYHQVIQTSLGLVIFLLEKNRTNILPQDSKKIFSYLISAKNALMKSQSLVDNIRRLERLYGQKDFKLVSRNLPDAITNAYSTVEQTLYDNNPHGKKIDHTMIIFIKELNIIADHFVYHLMVDMLTKIIFL